MSFDLGPDARISELGSPGPGHGPEVADAAHVVNQANFLACHQFDHLRPRPDPADDQEED